MTKSSIKRRFVIYFWGKPLGKDGVMINVEGLADAVEPFISKEIDKAVREERRKHNKLIKERYEPKQDK